MNAIYAQALKMIDREIELEETKTQLSEDDHKLYMVQLKYSRINLIRNAKEK